MADASKDPRIPHSVLHTDQSVENKQYCMQIRALLNEEQFDLAILAIIKIYGDHRLRKQMIRDYLIRLSGHLARLKPDLVLPSGWLGDESKEFSDTIKTSVILLGDEFMSTLIQLCVVPDFQFDRYLLHVFLEISLDGFLWNDLVNLCLNLATKDQKSRSPSKYTMIAEKLCNVRQIIIQCPNNSIANPFFDGVAEEDILLGRYTRKRVDEIIFPPGNEDITLADVDREITIALACAAISRAGCEPSSLISKTDQSLAQKLFKKTMDLRLYRESALLAKCCGVADVTSVFTDFADWVIMVTILADGHRDKYLKDTAEFLQRADLMEEERTYHKGKESSEAFIERTVNVIQQSLIDLYLELGIMTDLKAIISCYVKRSQRRVFHGLNQIIVDPQNFCEIIWHLLEIPEQHLAVYLYICDWASGISGRECIATTPVFTLIHGEDRVQLPYINTNLYEAIRNYFISMDPSVKAMWAKMEADLQEANQNGVYFCVNERRVISYSQPADDSESNESDQPMDSSYEDPTESQAS